MLFDHIIVQLHDLGDSAYLKGQFISLRELLKDWTELGIVVARHGGEEMMLKLILHATEQVFCDEVIASDSTCALKVVRDVTVWGI